MRIAIDIILVAIMLWCIYSGIRRGMINTLITIIAIIASLLVGSIVSSSFSSQLIPAFEPFVSGIADAQESTVMANIGYADSSMSLADLAAQEPEIIYNYSKALYQEMGVYEKSASAMAEEVPELAASKNLGVEEAAVEVFCQDLLYVLGTLLISLLVIIIFSAFMNLTNLSFHLPNMPRVEKNGGLIFGIVEGMLLCILFCWFLSFFGLVIGKDTLTSSYLARFFLSFGFVSSILL